MQPQTEMTVFGQIVKVNSDGFFIAPNGETFKAFTPRSLVNGRRVNMAQMLEAVRDRFLDGLTGSQIARDLSKDSDTIGKYKKLILAFNALDESAIIKQRETEAEFRNEKTKALLTRPEVAAWQERLATNEKTNPRTFAAGLNRACQILRVSPVALCQKETYDINRQKALDEINRLMGIVKQEIRKTSPDGSDGESSFYAVRMAVRNWLDYNGIHLPRGNLCPKNLSGKIVSSHGKAADVHASKEQIEKCNAFLENPKSKMPYPKRRIDTEIFFKFGIETASRETAIVTALLKNAKFSDTGKLTFETIERKLTHVGKHTQKKRIFCGELVRLIREKKAAGEPCLIGTKNEYMPFNEMENIRSPDLHPNQKQQIALKEIRENLRACYIAAGLTDEYFTKKPSHSLRHIAAQDWLRRSEFDYGFVAKLGGWNTLDELKTSYGEMPPEQFEKKYGDYINEG